MTDRNWNIIAPSSGNLNILINGVQALKISSAGVVTATVAGAPQVLKSSGVSASVTGTLTETQLAAITIPANTLGANGSLRVTTTWSSTSSANNKNYRVRFSGSGGAGYLAATVTTAGCTSYTTVIQNKNATNSQGGGSVGAPSSSAITSAVDTTASTTVYISGILANTGETITLVSYTVEFIPGV